MRKSKDYPVKGDRAGAMVSLMKSDDHSIDEKIKIDGKVLYVKSEDKERGTKTTWVAMKH